MSQSKSKKGGYAKPDKPHHKKLIENPGSNEAIKLGCKCPVIDNKYGKGLGNGLFWYAGDCNYHQQYPIHKEKR